MLKQPILSRDEVVELSEEFTWYDAAIDAARTGASSC